MTVRLVGLAVFVAACGVLMGCTSDPQKWDEQRAIAEFRSVVPNHAEGLSDNEIKSGGKAICELLDEGQTLEQLVNSTGAEADQDKTLAWAAMIFGVRVYCPQYSDQIPAERPF